uniref:Uncharacterized protein n=1 Tax=Timema poppense TaxID=170557 RepID=A0A7R9DN88_TIMPO|nr:unnamed protein product [Timema poppensis]
MLQKLFEPVVFVRDEVPTFQTYISIRSLRPEVNLGGLQWLFNVQLEPTSVPAICLRHDVDGCVWQAGPTTLEDADWPCQHVGTFLAFGYVQASKTQKKFTVCSPDLSYVAVCEATRHIYLYRQPSTISTELRNRRTGEHVAHVAKQQLVSIDSTSEVLGVHASNHVLIWTLSQVKERMNFPARVRGALPTADIKAEERAEREGEGSSKTKHSESGSQKEQERQDKYREKKKNAKKIDSKRGGKNRKEVRTMD